MRNLLALLGAAVVAFLVVGWYLGWYQISRLPSPNGKQSLHVDIHPEKITSDVQKGVEKGTEVVSQLRDRSKTEKPPAPTGPATSFFTPTSPAKEDGSSGGWRPIGDK